MFLPGWEFPQAVFSWGSPHLRSIISVTISYESAEQRDLRLVLEAPDGHMNKNCSHPHLQPPFGHLPTCCCQLPLLTNPMHVPQMHLICVSPVRVSVAVASHRGSVLIFCSGLPFEPHPGPLFIKEGPVWHAKESRSTIEVSVKEDPDY